MSWSLSQGYLCKPFFPSLFSSLVEYVSVLDVEEVQEELLLPSLVLPALLLLLLQLALDQEVV